MRMMTSTIIIKRDVQIDTKSVTSDYRPAWRRGGTIIIMAECDVSSTSHSAAARADPRRGSFLCHWSPLGAAREGSLVPSCNSSSAGTNYIIILNLIEPRHYFARKARSVALDGARDGARVSEIATGCWKELLPHGKATAGWLAG